MCQKAAASCARSGTTHAPSSSSALRGPQQDADRLVPVEGAGARLGEKGALGLPIPAWVQDKHAIARGGSLPVVADSTREGKAYLVIKDFQKMRQGVGQLLAELMRIKAEGDYDAIKALIDKYGVHFDAALRDQVVARYKKLNIPTYWTGINPELKASFDSKRKVSKVEISYPRDIVKQQLGYSAMYPPK